jgi:hypothetical protein
MGSEHFYFGKDFYNGLDEHDFIFSVKKLKIYASRTVSPEAKWRYSQ